MFCVVLCCFFYTQLQTLLCNVAAKNLAGKYLCDAYAGHDRETVLACNVANCLFGNVGRFDLMACVTGVIGSEHAFFGSSTAPARDEAAKIIAEHMSATLCVALLSQPAPKAAPSAAEVPEGGVAASDDVIVGEGSLT